ncbi:calcium-activated chloride channel regulator 1-like [Hoplias malabaricus]|uniref:calcium-activated chloride channel regulator 1-like n=1 Tax=Hoplias malabaricus TaxID=27720 RepID=UPI003462719A
MDTQFAVVLLVLIALGPTTGIRLDGNGYTDIVVAINPAVPENEALINQIKEMITSASKYLFQALDNMVFYKEVKILVPPNWRGRYERARRETYDKANIIIDYPHPLYGDEPYTKQTKHCGEEGEHVHFTPNFLLKDHLISAYGPRARVFVHEWAHLRWGVYDEYNEKEPFYIANKQILPTSCTSEITGQWYELINGEYLHCRYDETGLPSKECNFFPDKDQPTSASIMYLQNLDYAKTFCHEGEHNSEAPNMQNQKCNYKATRTVIFQDSVDSESLQTLTPLQSPPPPPIFRVIQRKNRVICLILDVSESMQGEKILRLQQATTLFLSQIIENGAYVGIVSTNADILSPLTKIEGKGSRDGLISKLPQTVSGSTSMCKGLRVSIEVLHQDDEGTVGDDVIFLTDAKDTDIDQACLESALNSGIILNTIAVGHEASDVLRTMASQTDGKFIIVDHNLLSNQLVDAFFSFTTSDGDPTKQTVQLVSTGKISTDWFNGTVPIDCTVGNSTTFTIIYEKNPPTVNIETPSGSVYGQSHITHNAAMKTIVLNVPGTAEDGDWKYSFFNREPTAQTIILIVTSRAKHDDVPPITVKTGIKNSTSNISGLISVFSEISQNYIPLLGAKVLATLQSDTGHPETLHLLDNGAGADVFKDDGIYSRYFTKLRTGLYNLKVEMIQQDGAIQLSSHKPSGAQYVPGYIVNGELQLNPPKPPLSFQATEMGNITRTAMGESFVVSVPSDETPQNFPPSKITDLTVEIQEDTVTLKWTAPGEDYDQGTAKSYEIRWSHSLENLQNNFSNANPVNTSALQPQEAGSAEQYSFLLEFIIQNGSTFFFGIQSEDEMAMKSEVSNIAHITHFVPSTKSSNVSYTSLKHAALLVSGCVAVMVACLIAVYIWALRRKKDSRDLLNSKYIGICPEVLEVKIAHIESEGQ